MQETTLTAFVGHGKLMSAAPAEVAVALWRRAKSNPSGAFLVFDDADGAQVDLDLSGPEAAVRARYTAKAPATRARAGAGRPKLGVVAREVTLLPRHWEWLQEQPNGVSASIRRLVDELTELEDESQPLQTITIAFHPAIEHGEPYA